MKIKPVLTEKSLDQAKKGFYTFWVDPRLNKNQTRKLIEDIFGVHVTGIKTLNYKAREKTNVQRKKKKIGARKKAIVTLKDKEKIDLFGEKK